MKLVVKEYKFLWRIYNSLYINLILELNKLFNDKENYSFKTLLNQLENNYKRIKWANNPDKSMFISINSILDDIEKQDFKEKIKDARDKFYAHLDINRPPSISIKISDLDHLIFVAQEIVNTLYSKLDDTQQLFKFIDSDIGHCMVDDLYTYTLIRHIIFKDIEEDKNNSYDKIVKVMIGN